MNGARHYLASEFPEFQHMIITLKSQNKEFAELLDQYDDTDKTIYGITQQMQPVSDNHLEELKKRRVLLKDKLYLILQQHTEAA